MRFGWALELGYRHIDTAQAYGNEESVGRALGESGSARGSLHHDQVLPREPGPGRRSRDRACGASASTSSICTSCIGRREARPGRGRGWRRRSERGHARSIGVSNFSVGELEQVTAVATMPPVVNQVQFSPFAYRKRAACRLLGSALEVEAYSPLGTGRHLSDWTVAEIAERIGRTPAQVLLRWCVQRQTIVIPKSTHRERIEENAQVFDFELADRTSRCSTPSIEPAAPTRRVSTSGGGSRAGRARERSALRRGQPRDGVPEQGIRAVAGQKGNADVLEVLGRVARAP